MRGSARLPAGAGGLIKAPDGEVNKQAGDVISCVPNTTFSRPVTHSLLMAQLDFSSEIQSVVGVMENIHL